MKDLLFCLFASAVALAAKAVTFDADTIAFYPFAEGADETKVTSTANAVDAELFRGVAYNYAVKGWTGEGLRYSDDVPGDYVFAGQTATTPLYAAGQYRSIRFPDKYKSGCAITTNAASGLWDYNRNDIGAVSMLKLMGLCRALAKLSADTDWTVEFFFKTDKPYCNQTPFSLCEYGNGDLSNVSNAGYFKLVDASDGYSSRIAYTGSGTGSKSDVALRWNTSNRPKAHAVVDGLWRHCALRYGAASNRIDVLLNYTHITFGHGGNTYHSFPYAADATDTTNTNSVLGVVRDRGAQYSDGPFTGKIAALRVTKRYLQPAELLRVADTADQSTPETVFHLSYDDRPSGFDATDPKQGSNDAANYGAFAGDRHRTSWRALGIFRKDNVNPPNLTFTNDVPARGVRAKSLRLTGDLTPAVNGQSLATFAPDATDTYQGGGFMFSQPQLKPYMTGDHAFTLETFFKLECLRVDKVCRVLGVGGVEYGLMLGYNGTASKLSYWYQGFNSDGTVESSRHEFEVSVPSGTSPVSDKKWHHFAISWDPVEKKVRYYYDYRLAAAVSLPYGIYSDKYPIGNGGIHIASWTGDDGWKASPLGFVDETRLTSRVLAPSEFIRMKNGAAVVVR